MNSLDKQNSLILVVTHDCNANCNYCQWGNNTTTKKNNQPDSYFNISDDILKHLKTQKIVLSGGEPLLRKDIDQIISYYRNKVQSVTLITNGILLTERRLISLINSGLTGITFSIDSLDDQIAIETRAYNKQQMKLIKSNFLRTCALKEKFNFEIGINVVVSAANIQNNNIENLVETLNSFPIDWIKFQPIFDDYDYVSNNSPHLLLSSIHSEKIRTIGRNISKKTTIKKNPINFWESLSDFLDGKKLLGKSCDLAINQAIAQNGKIKICGWIDFPRYDITNCPISETKKKFDIIKTNCITGVHCYCLQKITHKWETI